MAVIFSKSSGAANDYWNEWADMIQMKMKDTDNEKNNDDELVNALFNVKKSKRFGEKIAGLSTFGNFEAVDEGAEAPADTLKETEPKLITHSEFKKLFEVTKTMKEDLQFDIVATKAAAYVRAYKRSRAEFASAALTSAAKTFTYGSKTGLDSTTADGLALFDKAHTGLTGVATQSNVFTNAFGNDDAMLNRLANIGMNFKNATGHVMGYTFDTLIVPGNAYRLITLGKKIINSDQQVGSSFNDVNVNKGIWKLVVDHHWQVAEGTEPYIIMSSQANKDLMGSMFYDRTPLEIEQDVDVRTQNLISSGRGRFSAGFGDWRHIIMGGAAAGTELT
jgi:hypothetical protein|uniref:Major capsid protein n=1 Tax=Ackermannviridae sp. TaxID=2831612 RepID=A0A8S5VLM8_9CAUD|nr:MAG TPA: Major capsid protein [Ackermannviridae sp.]